MSFRIKGLAPETFRPLFSLSDKELKERAIHSCTADDSVPGYPCRISLQHAAPGERLLLVNYEHLAEETPYRSAHAIYVGEQSLMQYNQVGQIPEPIRVRQLSIRAFNKYHMIIDAELTDGAKTEELITKLFNNSKVEYLHIHYAHRGCYAACVERD